MPRRFSPGSDAATRSRANVPTGSPFRLRATASLAVHTKSAATIEEVTSHPLLDLFARPNSWLNPFDLWELTQVYLEVHGQAFWQIQTGPLGVPSSEFAATCWMVAVYELTLLVSATPTVRIVPVASIPVIAK